MFVRGCPKIFELAYIPLIYGRAKFRRGHIVFTRILLIAEHDGMLWLYRHRTVAAVPPNGKREEREVFVVLALAHDVRRTHIGHRFHMGAAVPNNEVRIAVVAVDAGSYIGFRQIGKSRRCADRKSK